MSALSSVEEILGFAIEKEEEAATFYGRLAGKMGKPWMKQVFEGFAKEELGHKAKLVAIRDGKKLLSAQGKVADLKIGDYLVEVDTTEPEKLDYQQALVIAMKSEKAAFRLYTDLAATTEDAEVRDVLLGLAQEEAKHKLRFEVEYDEFVLTDN